MSDEDEEYEYGDDTLTVEEKQALIYNVDVEEIWSYNNDRI